jgi:DUF4097 and DUF4098 domain-containing protein YvlB
MRALFTTILFMTASIAIFAGSHDRNHRRWGGHNFSVSTSDDSNSDDCTDHLNVWSDDYSGKARAEEEKIVGNQPLKITASRNGGIHVKQWDRNEIGIKVCKAALAENDPAAQQMVNKISLSVQGNTITVNGPETDDGRWSALLLLRVPKNAQLDLSANNGGISFNRVQLTATAHTHNGGISLNQASGKLDVEAENGGVSVKDCNGDIKVNVQNGGVALKLAETWTGPGLDARTHNGGLSVEVPANFKSSLEVQGSRHTAMLCKGDVCSRGQRTWDDDGERVLRIGSGTPVIRTSTVNGGVVVKNRGASREDDDSI